MDEEFELKYRWGFEFDWVGIRRCLWWAFQIDFWNLTIGVIFFGLYISWGRHVDRRSVVAYTTNRLPS